MKILNLVYPDKSDIKYNKIQFPDGQQQVIIGMGGKVTYTSSSPIQIKSRLNNFEDLELIICSTKSLRNLGVKEIHLYVPYFLGSRSDRKFEEGSNNYLKDIICPIINSLNFESITVLDPHSDILEACLNNYRKVSNLGLLQFAQFNIYERMSKEELHSKYILVSPDAGASKKIYKLAEQIGYKGDIITCSKDRDKDGKLTKTIVPAYDTGPLIMKDYIIIDDICDGGATFINIAKELKKLYNCNHIYLIVTHGIFSKGFGELSQYFDGIYCTNSYSDIEPPINFTERHHYIKEKVKQLNIF